MIDADMANNVDTDFFSPEAHVEAKEHLYFILCAIISIFFYVAFILACGLGIIIVLINLSIIVLIVKIMQTIAFAQLKQNAIKITEEQFSLVYKKSKEFSKKLKLKKLPEIYILQSSGALNAFATRFLFNDYVILYSDIMELAYKEGEDAVAFVVAHELAHLQRNHLMKYSLTFPIVVFPFLRNALSRACETTCDNIAAALVPNNSLEGLLVLLAGKELYKKVNVKEFLVTANKNYNHSAWAAEIRMSHPYLSRRLHNIAKKTNQEYVASLPKDMFKVSKFLCFITGIAEIIIWLLILMSILAGIGASSMTGLK